ncbi:centromere-like motif protein [Ranid herpesvirus 3]|uniref:Centromere-like motif protein n=1 Tax=Ranid herpesvirus 3 TaxID=1987509 RepID=A0A1X9T5E1_9VIRU|nr:centromere-like motif protein [Ranid herpesvirus 3]ARR28919.1 centromere-like motif protein [Ranid herpesvirus 3]
MADRSSSLHDENPRINVLRDFFVSQCALTLWRGSPPSWLVSACTDIESVLSRELIEPMEDSTLMWLEERTSVAGRTAFMNAATLCRCFYGDDVSLPETSLGRICFVTGDAYRTVPVVMQFDPHLYAMSCVKPEETKPHPALLLKTIRNYYDSPTRVDKPEPSSVEFFKAFAEPHILYVSSELRDTLIALSQLNLALHDLKWYLTSL